MTSFFRKLIRDVGVYGSADILLRGISFVSMPIYTRLLTPADFGVWSFVTTAAALVSGVISLGIDVAYGRCYFDAKTAEEKSLITSTALISIAAWMSLACLLLLPFSGLLSNLAFGHRHHAALIALSVLAMPVTTLNTIAGQALRNEFQSVKYSILSAISVGTTVAFSIAGLLVFHLGIAGLFAGALAGSVVLLPVRLWSIRRLLCARFSSQYVREFVRYGTPLIPGTLAYWVFASSDRLVLAKLSSLQEVGLYSVANGLTSILAFAVSAFGQAWSPRAIHAYEADQETARSLYGEALILVTAVFSFLSLAMTGFAPEALRLLTTAPYFTAAAAVAPLAIGFIAYATTQVTAAGISLTKQTRFFAIYAWVAALINLGLNVYLVPNWGMIGASWSTAVAYLYLTIAYYIRSQRLWPIAVSMLRLAGVVTSFIVLIIALRLLPPMPLAIAVLIKGLVICLYPGIVIAFRMVRLTDTPDMVTAPPAAAP